MRKKKKEQKVGLESKGATSGQSWGGSENMIKTCSIKFSKNYLKIKS